MPKYNTHLNYLFLLYKDYYCQEKIFQNLMKYYSEELLRNVLAFLMTFST